MSDGAACAIVTTPEIARSLGKTDLITVKALQLSVSNGQEAQHNSWDGSYFATTRIAAKRAYQEAGIEKPRDEISMMEVHDCFSITELVTMEDLHISREGEGWKDVLNGFYDADGQSRHLESGEPGKLRKVAEEMAARGQPVLRAPASGVDDAALMRAFLGDDA